MSKTYDVPVLYLVFNRPEHTRRSFEAIRARRPSRLFVAADGPRAHVPTDREQVEQVLRIATGVDWPCEVETLLRERNLGCAAAVSQAITWFFTRVESGIILEDDCVPAPVFWDYCALMLERYRDEPRVMCVSGNNFLPRGMRPRAPYYFSRYPNTWGWATWARAWAAYAEVPENLPVKALRVLLRQASITNPLSRWWWIRAMRRYVSLNSTTWDYRWVLAIWTQQGLSAAPKCNLVSNIGHDGSGTHQSGHSSNRPFPMVEPWGIDQARNSLPNVGRHKCADMVYDLVVVLGKNVVVSMSRALIRRVK